MKHRIGAHTGLLLALFVASTWGTAFAGVIESNVNRTFPVKPGGTLVVKNDRGSIHVAPEDIKEVRVEVRRKVDGLSAKEAAEVFDRHEVSFSASDERVEVTARVKGKVSRMFDRSLQKLQVSIRVAVPREFNLDLDTSAGAVEIGDLKGSVQAASSAGPISVGRVEGPIKARSSAGQVRIEAGTGPTVAETSGGGISLGEMQGDVHASSSAGEVRVRSSSGKLKAHSSGGGLRLEGLKGTVDGSTSAGSITAVFVEPPVGDSRLKTSAGGITVELPKHAALELNASTTAGSVSSEIPVTTVTTGKIDRDRLKGTLNGGGPKLELNSTAGSIRIKARN